jgi:cation diffusion facilitator family transporter
VGVEGTVIILAGISIMFMAVQNIITGFELQNLADGVVLVSAAGIINLVLGLYVRKVGREENSVIAMSNGKHVLTDVYTSAGVVVTLGLIYLTDWIYLDTIISFAIGIYIIREGFVLIRYSVKGIMDTRNPDVHNAINRVLMEGLPEGVKGWHQLRHRSSGQTTWIELHLIFDTEITLQDAHDLATKTERRLIDALKGDAIVTIHLEPEEPHDEIHQVLKGANKNRPLDDFI